LIGLAALSARYPVWFCDVWGVVHNGERPVARTVDGLIRHRRRGGIVILLTNSPRTAVGVERQLGELGVADGCRDGIVTSGDVTRALMVDEAGGRVYHVGPSRDLSIFDGLDIARVGLAEAHAVLCTGLFDEFTETAETYRGLLNDMKARRLTMICANPDRLVRKGTRLVPCAGAIAELYATLGGRVIMAGKPFAPIYDLAMAEATRLLGRPVARPEVLALGDGPDTDLLGAARYGLAAVLVADGVTDAGDGLDAARQRIEHRIPGVDIVATVHDLAWDEEG
jgi:HAD superfamily hydrolase (TIGR01459 family)